MVHSVDTPSLHDENLPRIEMRRMLDQHPLPAISQEIVDKASSVDPTKQAIALLDEFNAAMAANDAEELEKCFFTKQSYWKDQLALTYHLRTFMGPGVIAANLLETKSLRCLTDRIVLDGEAHFIPATPSLQFIDCTLAFRTGSPLATCSGRMLLLPSESSEGIKWKIWIFSTRLDNLDVQPEDKGLLQSPGRRLEGVDMFDTDVLIIGAGNAAITLAARLKALGVKSVMLERNAQVGDNWALRYDSLRFHVPTSFCEMPYMRYPKALQAPHLLSRDELAEQVRQYVAVFNLNVITSAAIQSTLYDQSANQWIVKFQTPAGHCTAVSKHLVQAAGIGSQKPYLPPMLDSHLYKGISIHSAHYKNAKQLSDQGAKTVLIIGSANTAFDVLSDCAAANLHATMVVRSPTYICPISYVCDARSLGVYDSSVAAADHLLLTLPTWVDAQLSRRLFAQFAAQTPNHYETLANAGFPVIDSSHPDACLMHNLIERGGGHYVDVGGAALLAAGKAGVKARTEPVAYTREGLRFADGSVGGADAVVWCTGFADRDARGTVAEVLGGGGSVAGEEVLGGDDAAEESGRGEGFLGPGEIAARVDATWGVDAEGEIRGLWKRQARLDNFWIAGGYTQQHRWHSRTLALQIKAALEGILPPAYRETRGEE